MSTTLEVLYEDPALIAVAKPAGSLVVPGRGPSEGEPLVRLVGRRCGGVAFAVHRLDREVSGVVLFAKTAAAHRALCREFETRRVHKRYLAAVRGRLEGEGRIDKPLREFGSGRVGVDPRGKESLTRWRVLRALKEATLTELEPTTGRRHQLRVHLYAIGHPIIGETRYGTAAPDAPRLMLHALELELRSPLGRPLKLRAEPPPDFAAVLKSLEP